MENKLFKYMFIFQEMKKETGKECNSKAQSLGMFIFIPNSEKTEVKGTDKCTCKVHLMSSKRRKTPLLILDADFCWHSRTQAPDCPEAQSTVPA